MNQAEAGLRKNNHAGSPETIVALSTPEGTSGLAVVRLSGLEALTVAREVFQNDVFAREPESHHAYYGFIVWPPSFAEVNPVARKTRRPTSPKSEKALTTERSGRMLAPGDPVDEVIALPMLSPRSYTGEDSVEFFCHGGRVPARLVIEACLRAGAVPAGPGEFTRRAFLNGKLSLDQAEAVADLIHAEDEMVAGAAFQQMRGGFDRELAAIEEPLQDLLALLEGSLEFGEDEEVEVSRAHQAKAIEGAIAELDKLLALAPAGRHLREGVQVVMVGPPNVGKSALFNTLLGEERVLVDHEPGTTRDVVTARTYREGILFVLHDTAGLRPEGGRVEKMGMQRTKQSLEKADIVVFLQEGGAENREREFSSTEIDRFWGIGGLEGVESIQVVTKMDLCGPDSPSSPMAGERNRVETSAKTGAGIELLWQKLLELAREERLRTAVSMGVVMNARHQRKLVQCATQLSSLRNDLVREHPGEEVVATLLAGILADLGEVSGRIFTESLLDSVFSRFCVGK